MFEQHCEKGKQSGKGRLLIAARELVQERPFDEITIDEIIKKAGLSRPAFYYHFAGGKEELRAEFVKLGVLPATPVQDIRQVLLEAALRVFARAGISAATLEDIAAEASVTRGTLTWHFHSKEDLLVEIVKHYSPHSRLRSSMNEIEQDLQNGVPLDDKTIFCRVANAFYDAFTDQSDYARLAMLLVYTHPEASRIIVDRMVKGRKYIAEYIHKRQEEGHFRQDIGPEFFVQVMAMTFAMRAMAGGSNELLPFGKLPKEEVINQLVSLLLYGMVQRDPASE